MLQVTENRKNMMRVWIILFCLAVFAVVFVNCHLNLKQRINEVHRPANYNDKGFWKTHIEWKARWVKEWHEKKILVPIWRKVWGPLEINEWVPLPLVPPTTDK